MAVNPVIQKANSFEQNSKAQNDSFKDLSSNRDSFILDVLANDQGGLLKVLWSLDDGIGPGNEPGDLLTRDNYDAVNYSELGAQISITKYGTVSYVITPELQAKLRDLSAGESLTDTFVYAMKIGQGNTPLSWATATVTLNGLNHAPELTGTTAILPNGMENTGYEILTSDLLKGFTDADKDEITIKNLLVTHGSLTETAAGWIFTPESNFSGDVELSYDIVDGHGGSLGATLKFTLEPAFVDTDPPVLAYAEPADDATGVPVTNNIVLHFNEGVTPGSGNIVVTNGTDTRLIAVDDSSQVTFSGSKVIINPSTNLVPNTTYHVEMANGVIADYSGNPYAGIDDPSTLNFTTTPDTAPPVLNWSWPTEGQPLKIDDNITLNFSKEIMAGNGSIIISNGTDTRVIAIDDASQVTIDNFTGLGTVNYGSITINPTEDLIINSTYSIQIAAGVITDTSGNAWEGINDALSFSTIGPGPLLLSWSNPGDDGTDFQMDNNIELSFDEAVKPGSTGNIVISNGTDTRIISINDSSQVTFDGYNGVIINPTTDLAPNTHYSIKIDSGAITDLDGNSYAGISDDSTLDFSTVTSEPRLYNSYPVDDSTDFQVDQSIGLFFNEPVKSGGSGNIIISNGTDTRIISINDSSQVTFDGYNGVIINPTTDLTPNTHYSIKIDSGAITDLSGNPYNGISDDSTLDFSTITGEPRLNGSNPGDDSTGFQEDQNIELYFNEQVKPGDSGNIIISNGSDTRTIAINDASQVTFSGGKVTINPTADLVPNTNYSIKIDSTAITDLDGNPYAGISDDTTLNFSTITSEPRLFSTTPWDESTDFPADNNITLTFNEEVQAGSSGNIVISNGSDIRTIAINDASQVTFNGSKITVNPTADLVPNTNYSIRIDNGAITDLGGHAYAGINDDTTLNFSTISTEPRLYGSNPWDDSIDFPVDNNITLFFNETIQAGSSGNIIISNGSDTRTIAINDASQVTFDGYSSVTINPAADLIPDTNYSIRIDNGAILDLSGNAYAGISDDTTLNFSMVTTEPRLSWSNPWDGSTDFQVDQDIALTFNQLVKQGANGNIIISNGSDTRTIAINDSSQVTFDGYTSVIINPTDDLVPNTHYSIKIDNGAITDPEGNSFAGISDDTTLDFSTISSDPQLFGSYPWDNFSGFQVDRDIELYFNEPVKSGGSGNIIISNGSDTRTIAINDASQVSFDNSNRVVINPLADLIPGTHYNIKIDNGAITDLTGHAYAGISDDTALDFTTITGEPRLDGSIPGDDSIDFQVDRNITLYFNEPVKSGGSGNIIISNGSDTRTISISDSSQVTFDGYTGVIINPTTDLAPNTDYSIRIDSGAITDLAGNPYAGISDDTSLNFTTIPSNPLLVDSSPVDNASDVAVGDNIVLYFNEEIKPASGNIVISNGTDIRTISINDSSQVTFSDSKFGGNQILINPAADLVPNTTYHIEIDASAITDTAGNYYAGISDDTTLNFTTTDTLVTPPIVGVAGIGDPVFPVL